MTYSRGQTISVKNIDSVDAPAFALLYVADSESRDDELVLHVRRPTATDIGASNSGNYVFNGGVLVKAGGYGSAKTGSFGLVMCQNPGLLLGPTATSWYLNGNSAALMFTSVGPDATEASKTGAVKTRLVRAGETPSSFIAVVTTAITGRSGTTAGKGKATLRAIPGVAGTATTIANFPSGGATEIDVYNVTTQTVAVGKYITVKREGASNKYIVDLEDCA